MNLNIGVGNNNTVVNRSNNTALNSSDSSESDYQRELRTIQRISSNLATLSAQDTSAIPDRSSASLGAVIARQYLDRSRRAALVPPITASIPIITTDD